jgi:hypothetical protein
MCPWFLDVSMVLGSVGGSRMCPWFLDISVVLRCVYGFWMCQWFLDLSVVLGCVQGFCQNLTKIKSANKIQLKISALFHKNSLIVFSTVLPEKLTVPQLVKKSPTFHGTRMFITAFTTARHLSLS